HDAIQFMIGKKLLSASPISRQIASVSVGIYQGVPVLDLDYPEDSNAHTDMNVIMDENGHFIEVQGTAEGAPFTPDEMQSMLSLAGKGINELMGFQNAALSS
ncbi:MAG: ribonuclease PH, partial [Gammaproteobacteria bacterium]|nr:ribonuclease PH [Gammaproteobacteria bacterium]